MSSTPQVNKPSPVASDIPWSSEPPTQPVTYWFKREPASRAVMMDVRETDAQFTLWCPNPDSRAFVPRLSTN
jgi:hypothetical protein